jgi:hypothetical protein
MATKLPTRSDTMTRFLYRCRLCGDLFRGRVSNGAHASALLADLNPVQPTSVPTVTPWLFHHGCGKGAVGFGECVGVET